MSLKTWAIATAIVKATTDVNKRGLVLNIAADIDKYLDQAFPKRSENIQAAIAKNILIPLVRELMIDNLSEYDSMLMNEANFIEIETDRRESNNVVAE